MAMPGDKPLCLKDLTNAITQFRDELRNEFRVNREKDAKMLEVKMNKLKEEIKRDINGLVNKMSKKLDRQLEWTEASFSQQFNKLRGDIGILQNRAGIRNVRSLVFAGGRLVGNTIRGYRLEFPPIQLFRLPQ